MLTRLRGFNAVANVACLEEEVPSTIDNRFVGHDVVHLPIGHLADPGAQMIVMPDVPSGSDRDLRHAELVFTPALQFKGVVQAALLNASR
jgi:hypothetical protein